MHWVNRILVALIAAGILAYWPERFDLAVQSEDLERIRRERAALADKNDEIREDIRLMEAEIRALKSDPAEIARIAREELNLIRPGEVVFEVEHVPATP